MSPSSDGLAEEVAASQGKPCRDEDAGLQDEAAGAEVVEKAAEAKVQPTSVEDGEGSFEQREVQPQEAACRAAHPGRAVVAVQGCLVAPEIESARISQGGPTDLCIVEALVAPVAWRRQLLHSARRVQTLLRAPSKRGAVNVPSPVACVELYGSVALSLDRLPGRGQDCFCHYVRPCSDIDLVVLLREGAKPEDAVWRLRKAISFELLSTTSVRKFATTQFTMRGGARGTLQEMSMDLTCIDSSMHFTTFRRRQTAFQETFWTARRQLEASYGDDGTLAFDAYIHLLRAFASSLPASALSGFQATCFGLFTLQLRLHELRGSRKLTGLVLFECFLRFCQAFFDGSGRRPERPDDWHLPRRLHGFRYCAVDISLGGRLLPRLSDRWRCELYILGAEVHSHLFSSEHVNIAHSVVPETVCRMARETLAKSCSIVDGQCCWT